MKSDLHELLSLLSNFPELEFQCKGTGNAKFIYICSETRAAEVSIAPPSYFFEAWGVADAESDESPLISMHIDSIQKVEMVLKDWFGNNAEK